MHTFVVFVLFYFDLCEPDKDKCSTNLQLLSFSLCQMPLCCVYLCLCLCCANCILLHAYLFLSSLPHTCSLLFWKLSSYQKRFVSLIQWTNCMKIQRFCSFYSTDSSSSNHLLYTLMLRAPVRTLIYARCVFHLSSQQTHSRAHCHYFIQMHHNIYYIHIHFRCLFSHISTHRGYIKTFYYIIQIYLANNKLYIQIHTQICIVIFMQCGNRIRMREPIMMASNAIKRKANLAYICMD